MLNFKIALLIAIIMTLVLYTNCFLITGSVNIVVRRIKCISFVVHMALLPEDEKMLNNMLLELNDRCEDHGMVININKMKTMVIGRKPKKGDMRIKDESSNKWTASNNWGAI